MSSASFQRFDSGEICFSSLQKGKSEDLSEDARRRSAGGLDPSGALSAFLALRERLDIYKREAPELLKELAVFLSQHKGEFPRGIGNILDCSWEDLTAGAVVRRSAAQPCKPAEHRAPSRSVTAASVRKTPLHSYILRKHIYIQGHRTEQSSWKP